MNNTHIITGGTGFIAYNLVKWALACGDEVFVIDRKNQTYMNYFHNLPIILANLADLNQTIPAFAQIKPQYPVIVWHLAANSDIPAGVHDSNIDYQDTFLTTYHTGLAMKHYGFKTIYFASTSAVYGDHGDNIISELTAPLMPISNYGAMKLAGEAILSAFAEQFIEKLVMFRFPNVVGAPATHGIIFDLIHKLQRDQMKLPVLGDGTQRKSYLHVTDLVNAMVLIGEKTNEKRTICNIGPTDNGITIKEIAQMVRDEVAPNALIQYGSGSRGWVGDVPKFCYNVDKMVGFGFKPTLNSKKSVALAVKQIKEQLL